MVLSPHLLKKGLRLLLPVLLLIRKAFTEGPLCTGHCASRAGAERQSQGMQSVKALPYDSKVVAYAEERAEQGRSSLQGRPDSA